jgi:hypothetical protein
MHADMLADDELHAGKPDPLVRQHGGVEREFGVAEIEHDRGPHLPGFRRGHAVDFECEAPLIDLADFAIRA